MLTKDVVVGTITIWEDQRLLVRLDTVIREDGVELSRQYHRYTLSPGDDVREREWPVRRLAEFLWTPEVIAQWKVIEARLMAQRPIAPSLGDPIPIHLQPKIQ